MEYIRTKTCEVQASLRTVRSYEDNIKLYNPSKTGIKEYCVLNYVDGFHVCNNVTLDLMHDLFEGWVNTAMKIILNHLIFEEKFFTLDLLNTRFKEFKSNNNVCDLPKIKKEHIDSSKKMKLSANEMIIFSKYFGLVIGDKVNSYSEAWNLYVKMRKIIFYVISPRYVEGHLVKLDDEFPQFIKMYKKLVGNIVYKLHNGTHITRVMKKNGPMANFLSMRFESKHRQLKLTAVTTNNRQYLLKTLCTKSLLQLAYLRVSKSFYSIKNSLDENNENIIDDFDRKQFFSNIDTSISIFSVKSVEFKDIKYNINMILVVEISENEKINFGRIKNIFIVNQKIFLLLQPLVNNYFDTHYFAYNVKELHSCFIKNVEECLCIHECVLCKKNELLYVATKYIL